MARWRQSRSSGAGCVCGFMLGGRWGLRAGGGRRVCDGCGSLVWVPWSPGDLLPIGNGSCDDEARVSNRYVACRERVTTIRSAHTPARTDRQLAMNPRTDPSTGAQTTWQGRADHWAPARRDHPPCHRARRPTLHGAHHAPFPSPHHHHKIRTMGPSGNKMITLVEV